MALYLCYLAIGILLLLVTSRRPCFNFTSPLGQPSLRPKLAQAGLSVSQPFEETDSVRPQRVAAVGLCALVAALAARKGRSTTSCKSRVILRVRKPTRWAKKAVKGYKPLIQRKITRDVWADGMEGFMKNKKAGVEFLEKVVRQTLSGHMQFQIASKNFFDAEPLFGNNMRPKGRYTAQPPHDYDSLSYVRKFLEPAKFKKLAIAHWEMPENATRVVTLDELLEAGCQYGHRVRVWNQKMLPLLYTENDGSHIFDLVKTAGMLNRACYYCMEAAAKGANFIMIGTKDQAKEVIDKYAKECDVFYCAQRYTPGLITNLQNMRPVIDRMTMLEEEQKQGQWNSLSDTLRENNTKELKRKQQLYKGVETMTNYPDICIFVDAAKERNAILEMARMGIPCIGICDSNNRIDFVDMPIGANTSTSRSIELIIRKLSEAIKKGKMMYAQSPPRQEDPKEWDPWLHSRDRIRVIRRRSKQQGWMKGLYGNYETYKRVHPWGNIVPMVEFQDFKWNDWLDGEHV